MTTAAQPLPDDRPSSLAIRLLRVDRWLTRASERLNPILIKEARQSLKSRQFVMTFGLLLLAVWGWTALSVTMLQTQGLGSRATHGVFAGYFIVLEVPLLVIVPFSAFRSLASEREDGTFELVSITTLGARQIVMGKLASSLLQVMVYFSVIAPCIAFTYMLRGIDLPTIFITLAYTLLFSIGLVSVGLLFASSVRSIHWQILASVLMLGVLALAAFLWPSFVFQELLDRGLRYDARDFWWVNACIVSMTLVFCWLFLAAATAELSFASDNRSTKLRVIMLVVQAVFTGWMLFFFQRDPEAPMLIIMSFFATGFWAVMGGLMTGERPELSPRVRRGLPKSFLGRMAFTWFNPGSATGYAFAVTNAVAVLLAVVFFWTTTSNLRQARFNYLEAAALAVSYMAIYLGIGRMVLMALRKVADFSVVVALMIQSLIVVLGVLLPVLLHSIAYWNQPGFRYTWLQIPNWGLTIATAVDRPGGVTPGVPLAVHATAVAVFVLNLILAAKEVHQLRETTPERVLEDERERLGIPVAAPATPRSPFDD